MTYSPDPWSATCLSRYSATTGADVAIGPFSLRCQNDEQAAQMIDVASRFVAATATEQMQHAAHNRKRQLQGLMRRACACLQSVWRLSLCVILRRAHLFRITIKRHLNIVLWCSNVTYRFYWGSCGMRITQGTFERAVPEKRALTRQDPSTEALLSIFQARLPAFPSD